MLCSPTYREEEESRLQDFTDDELDSLSTSGQSSPRLSPRLNGPTEAASGQRLPTGGGRVPALGLVSATHACDEDEIEQKCLAQSRSNLSQLDGSLRSCESGGGDRFRDSIDTVVRVSLSSPQDSRTSTLRGGDRSATSGPGPQLECMFR